MIQRKYWHISDVLLVLNEWSSETAIKNPVLPAIADVGRPKRSPESPFLMKRLKCLSWTVEKFLKPYPKLKDT